MKPLALIATLVSLSSWCGAENWPQFRGPTGQGISSEKNLPTQWDKSHNLAWQIDVPGEGWSSPIVWDQKLFLTYTTDNGVSCHIRCVETGSGKVAWDREVFRQKPTRKEGQNSYATPTPVTDGQAVYAFFAEGGAAALSLDGKPLWTNLDNSFYSQHGLGASPILYKHLLIMPFDWSSPTGELRVGWQIPWDKSFVLALDKQSGKLVYKAARGQSRIGHLTPQIVDVDGRPQLVSAAGDIVEGFDPETGQRIWWLYNGGEGVVPSPVIGDGMIFTSSGFPTQAGPPIYAAIRAFRLGGSGDMSGKSLVWEEKRAVPMIPSFALANHLLFTIKEDGIAQCFDEMTGKLLWKHRLDGTYHASPVVADGHVYYTSDDAVTTVVACSDKYQEISTNPLVGPCQASMAISGGHLFLRTATQLFCIGPAAP